MFGFFQKTDPTEIVALCCRANERITLVRVVRRIDE